MADFRAPTPSAAAEVSVPSQEELIRLLAIYKTRAFKSVASMIENYKVTVKRLIPRNPEDKIRDLSQKLDMKLQALEGNYKEIVNNKIRTFTQITAKLDTLSPLKTLLRGYSIATDNSGRVLRNAEDFASKDEFKLRLHNGDIDCLVK